MSQVKLQFDRLVTRLILSLAVLILLMVLIGDKSVPRLQMAELTSQDYAVGSVWKFDFSRLMDRKSVEDAFEITPKVDGVFSWNGKTMYFELKDGLESGKNYLISLDGRAKSLDGKVFTKTWTKQIHTEPMQIAYLLDNKLKIDGKGEYDLNGLEVQQMVFSKTMIYLLALKPGENPELWQLNLENKKLEQLTFDQKYLNKNFKISDNGKRIALSRIELGNGGEYASRIEVWLADTGDFVFRKFLNGEAQGTDFDFSPEGSYLLFRNKDANFELVNLDEAGPDKQGKFNEKAERLFIGEFADAFGFHPFQPKLAFSEYDQEDVYSLNNKLVIFSGDGEKKYLEMGKGVVRQAIFTPDGNSLIVLFSGEADNLTGSDDLVESRRFHLYRLDLKDYSIRQLTSDDDFSELNAIISPDSRYVLYQRVLATPENLIDPAFQNIQENLGNLPDRENWMLDLRTGENKKLFFKANKFIVKP
ncbi:WD40 repeat domain-containing protein [Candidatus Peregrinibacteria bacterium]|nr:WD40 repeat domain-containing protein [Candidatus Peregrinibacteria bacterium]